MVIFRSYYRIIRWPRSVTTQFNNYSKHISIFTDISKFETQFDNCPQHISIFTTHFNIHNMFQYSQHIFEHFNGNIGERRYWSEMVRSNAAIFMNE